MNAPEITPALLAFAEPWLAREPALHLGAQFAGAGAEYLRFVALHALIRELCTAAVAVSDARVGAAKLGWWQEEAIGWARGSCRHPLAQAWPAPEHAAPALLQLASAAADWMQRPTPGTASEAAAALESMALASALLAGDDVQHLPGWTLIWYAFTLRLSAQARAPLATVIPLEIWARHSLRRSDFSQQPAAVRAAVLADSARAFPPGNRSSRLPAHAAMMGIEQRWLMRTSRGRASGRIALGDVWAAWRAARRARSLPAVRD